MNNKGFTLLELMIVIGILGIFMVIAAPRFGGAKADFGLHTTGKNCVLDIRYAQQLSIDTKDNHRVFFNPTFYTIEHKKDNGTWEIIKQVSIRNGVIYEKITEEPSENQLNDFIEFDSTGAPLEDDGINPMTNKSKIHIKAAEMYAYIRVTPSTGEVSFKWD